MIEPVRNIIGADTEKRPTPTGFDGDGTADLLIIFLADYWAFGDLHILWSASRLICTFFCKNHPRHNTYYKCTLYNYICSSLSKLV